MKVAQTNIPFDILVLQDVYSDYEIQRMLLELEVIYSSNGLEDPLKSGTALYDDGTPMKKNKALFLDNVYSQEYRFISPILSYSETKLLSKEVKSEMYKINASHGILFNASSHNTLVSYYENFDHYDFHKDSAAYTFLSYIWKEPKKFSGGDIVFDVNDQKILIEIQNNMAIIFPSSYSHAVTEVEMNEEYRNKMYGRFCITNFIGIGAI